MSRLRKIWGAALWAAIRPGNSDNLDALDRPIGKAALPDRRRGGLPVSHGGRDLPPSSGDRRSAGIADPSDMEGGE
jgi:hypothetical protein